MYRFTEELDGEYRIYTIEEKFSRMELREIYDTEIDKETYPWFENWMSEMRRTGLVEQLYPSETELYEYARECSKEIVIRSYEPNGSSRDERREATKVESEVIFNIIYGALLGVRSQNSTNDGLKIPYSNRHAAIDSAEFIAHRFIPEMNTYDTIFRPVDSFFEC